MDLDQVMQLLITSILIHETLLQDVSGWQSHYLDSYRFIPIPGHCYQIYYPDDFISTCRREPDLQSQSCIRWTSSDRSCLGLTTPTNETVLLRCTTRIRFDTCFEVYDANQRLNILCQEIIEGHAVGIKTPDNFTILLHNDLCRTSTNLMEREIYSNFVNTFSLDVDTRSCYKVYSEEKLVNPYNCLSPDIEEACVFDMEGCTALTTAHNEVLILDCPDAKQKPEQENCFYLYNSDNKVHTVCQEKLEERCVGIVTPSNLTVLFECFFCSEFMNIVYFNKEAQKRQRHFVKNYLAKEYLGKNSHLIDSGSIVFNGNQFDSLVFPNWFPNTSCYGIKLDSNETVILKCMVQRKYQEPAGCFSMVSALNDKHSVCAEVLSEACVGLKVSNNVSIALACYGSGDYRVENDKVTTFFLNSFQNFLSHGYRFYSLYVGHKGNVTKSLPVTNVQRLNDKPECLGLETENEVVILECYNSEVKRNGCFDVVKKTNNSEISGQAEQICLKILDDKCVGIVTPSNWTLQFDCFVHFAYAQGAATAGRGFEAGMPGSMSGSTTGFISQNIPSYSLPPRY